MRSVGQAAASTLSSQLQQEADGEKGKYLKLAASIAVDAIGVVSYALPGLGEAEDVAWAPISALVMQAMYGSALLSTLDFLEEALPFSDILPTACIGWVL